MVTIRGYRHTNSIGYLRIHVKCEDPPIDKQIPFVVDTGASMTVISEGDCIELGIDFDEISQKCPLPRTMRGIGGTSLCYEINDVELWFQIPGDKWLVERVDSIGLMKHENETAECSQCGNKWTWKENENAKYSKSIPSLLGIDILRKFKINITDKYIILEK